MIDAIEEKLFRFRSSCISVNVFLLDVRPSKTHHGSLGKVLDQARPRFYFPLAQNQAGNPRRDHVRHFDNHSYVRRKDRLVIIRPGLVETLVDLDSLEMVEFHDGQLTCELDRLYIGDFEGLTGCDAGNEGSGRGKKAAGYDPPLRIAFALSLRTLARTVDTIRANLPSAEPV